MNYVVTEFKIALRNQKMTVLILYICAVYSEFLAYCEQGKT
jgi:hypothetical protein